MQGLTASQAQYCTGRPFTVQQRRPTQRAHVEAVRATAAEAANRPKRPSEGEEGVAERPSQSSGRGSAAEGVSGVSVDFQRKQAKAMIEYFKARDFSEQVENSQFFGWTKGNEITNGRWVMFGFAVGLLTEYATGVDFPHQFGLMASYLGLTDFFD